MRGPTLSAGLAVMLALAACSPRGADDSNRQRDSEIENQQTVDIPQTVNEMEPGATPMAERVAVLGLLNKRNGLERDLTLRPGQAVRVGDAIVRLRACETTAPWEAQQYTGAFVQLDVRGADGQFRRVFSGWLFKESPSLNVVEHPIYDVWPKSCAMTHPEGGTAAPVSRAGAASSRSSASNSTGPAEAPANGAAPAAPPPRPEPSPSADANSAR
jgi:hypothetical protein